ncbi:MAG: hypothetical protein TEF_13620 [Rhizobiales bacterium NRL2]|nr:MAG: hypothetical protein TEF_13620 [Rhizobiales bacterium NRL2]
MRLAPEVAEAKARGAPVVALESTIIAHGFPWPDNLELAREMEDAVRAAGAAPATIAILDGEVRIGLAPAETERLAGGGVAKCALGDVAAAIAAAGDGATTVSATAHLARRAGIDVFATGGIGGVHPRTGDDAPDISADLPALGRTCLLVVASGAKSILDLPATLEVLETEGVALAGYGVDILPAFHTADSGLVLRHRVDSPAEAAALLRAQRRVEAPSAVLIANPPPAEFAIARERLDGWIARAGAEAAAAGIGGAGLTPWLLRRLDTLSEGETTRVNRALAIANARLGAEIAVAFAAA